MAWSYCNASALVVDYFQREFLRGGIRSGQVVEIIGSTSAGKSHICHSLTAHISASHPPVLGHRVLVLDCCGHFSIAKLLTFVEKECENELKAGDKEEFHVAQTMKRISVKKCLNLEELLQAFKKLLHHLKTYRKKSTQSLPIEKRAEVLEKLPELIVIDSLSSAFCAMPVEVSCKTSEGKRSYSCSQDDNLMESLIAEFSLTVRHLAVLANLAIVITNPIPVPELLFTGSYFNAWTQACHVRLLIEITLDSNEKDSVNFNRRRNLTLKHYSYSKSCDGPEYKLTTAIDLP